MHRLLLTPLALAGILVCLPAQAAPRTRCAGPMCKKQVRTARAVAPASAVANASVNLPLIPPPDWQAQLLVELGKQNDRDAYLQALVVSGLAKGAGFYGAASSYALNPAGVSGTSLYGYNVGSYQSFGSYGDVDLNQLFQSLERTTGQAQQLAGQAHTAHADVVGRQGAAHARVAMILALAKGAQQAASDPPSVTLQSAEVGPVAPPPVPPEETAPTQTAPIKPHAAKAKLIRNLVLQTCVSCHGAAQPKAGLNLAVGWDALTDAQRASVRERVTTQDKAKRMPKDKDALPLFQQQSFFQ